MEKPRSSTWVLRLQERVPWDTVASRRHSGIASSHWGWGGFVTEANPHLRWPTDSLRQARAYLCCCVAAGGFVLQPHEDISILFGLDLEYFIIFESNSFNIRLKGKEVKVKGEVGERGGKRPKTMSPRRHSAVKPATGQAKATRII